MRNSNLAKFRAEKELSTMDIAKIIGVSTSFYEKIEYGQRKPSYNFIVSRIGYKYFFCQIATRFV